MPESRAVSFFTKDHEGKETTLFVTEDRWGGYTRDTVEYLIDVAKDLEGIRVETTDAAEIRERLIAKLKEDAKNGGAVFKDDPERFLPDPDWHSSVDVTDPARPLFHLGCFIQSTLADELDNHGAGSIQELFDEHGFLEIGGDPVDCGVFVAVRDGLPLTGGGLRHLRDMLNRLPDGGGDGGGGFIPHGCAGCADILETY